MGKLLTKLPWGKVCLRTVKTRDDKGKILITDVPYFRGSPDLYVVALADRHPNLADQLRIVTGCLQGSATPDPFWEQAQAIINKKIKLDAEAKVGKKL
jgi:hypothetical protein